LHASRLQARRRTSATDCKSFRVNPRVTESQNRLSPSQEGFWEGGEHAQRVNRDRQQGSYQAPPELGLVELGVKARPNHMMGMHGGLVPSGQPHRTSLHQPTSTARLHSYATCLPPIRLGVASAQRVHQRSRSTAMPWPSAQHHGHLDCHIKHVTARRSHAHAPCAQAVRSGTHSTQHALAHICGEGSSQ
jgi:hypothetical protein